MDSPYRRELEVAIGAVQAAAGVSRAVISAVDKHVMEKEDLSPVTVADFAIQALLTKTLQDAFPGDRFVAEETAGALRSDGDLLARVHSLLLRLRDAPNCTVPESEEAVCDIIGDGSGGAGRTTRLGADSGRVWVFDPIDGTKTFVRGEMYGINVALLEGGRQMLSVVACPLLSMDARAPVANDSVDATGQGCILFAVRGHGAYVRPLPGSPAEVQVRKLQRHADAVLSVDQLKSVSGWSLVDSGIGDVHKTVTEKLGVQFPGCDLLGWVPRWAVMALGLANMTVWVYKSRDRHAKIWDHAGAMLLFEEVGGIITDVDGKDIDLSAGRKLSNNFGFVAAPRSVHQAVLKAVREALRPELRV
ncbi:hypothetical protein QBC46DRAFT_400393 [Diplogelasinospora grovesii]|uniref:Uncharacterized protein n=1 Tax=Diplogelasinospora grovesii TaxID=303347 RepID=A0AAN6RYU3_9PEZI|nr:hypothetical protein QBC46DRAFT_400393 [Diplogelasinospora grovesii]